jgi:pimeloyl-ACP methyl ester carboxylesterase
MGATHTPYTMNQGIHIHYHFEGEGPPLVLQHGFTSRLEAWRQFGYVQALQHSYQLILLDARGHGASDKPHDLVAYALPKCVGDVMAVLDALNIAKAHFCGYSMGGWIGFAMARYAPERVESLIIRGAHPYRDSGWDVFRQVDGTDPETLASGISCRGGRSMPLTCGWG